MRFTPWAALSCAAFSLLLSGCASDSTPRRDAVLATGATLGFTPRTLVAGGWSLLALQRQRSALPGSLTVYLEGDGAPWPNPFHPPADPTPLSDTVLQMAAADPSAQVVYLGRPCQYLAPSALRQCDAAWRDERRFAPEVVAAYDAVIDRLRRESGARELRLVGYSGGGVLAALLAARRTDIVEWVSVAAPLDLARWVADRGNAPLDGSLDPNATDAPPHGRAWHWAGADDRVVPPAIVAAYVQRHGGTLRVVAGYDHACCWARDWAQRLKEMEP